MKPLTEQLKKLEGIPVPDFGPLDDWAANRNAEMQRRARRAAGKAFSYLLGTACIIHISLCVIPNGFCWLFLLVLHRHLYWHSVASLTADVL